jgi:hypothetical protein
MTIDHRRADRRIGKHLGHAPWIIAVAILVVGACAEPPAPRRGPYQPRIPESVRLANAGVRDTVLLRRWRAIDSLVASESGDSLAKLYLGAIHAGPGEGQKYMAAISCENDRIMKQVGILAGGLVLDRVNDSVFANPAVDSAFSQATRHWPQIYQSGVCDLSHIRQAPESLTWRPNDFPKKE